MFSANASTLRQAGRTDELGGLLAHDVEGVRSLTAGAGHARVVGELGGLARPDRRTCGNPRGPHRLAAGQRGDALVVASAAATAAEATASLMLACWTGGASVVKNTWSCVPRSTVAPAGAAARRRALSAQPRLL